MTEPVQPPSEPFVPVAEVLRERGERSWLGEPWSKPELLVLLLVTLAGGALRLWHLEQWSLSTAEAELWRGATEPLRGEQGFLASQRCNYPLGFLGLRWALGSGLLLGQGEGWLRLPFAFVGTLCVPLLALVGELFVARRVALLAAALLAIHPWHLAASQTASGEVLAGFFVLLGGGLLCIAHRTRGRRFGLLAAAAAFAAVAAHPSAWWSVLAVALVALHARSAPRWRNPVLGIAVVLTVLLPIVALRWNALTTQSPSLVLPWLEELLDAARPATWILAGVGFLAAASLAVAGGAASCAWGLGGRPGRRWLVAVAVLPLVASALLVLAGVSVAPRTGVVALPALLGAASVLVLGCFDRIAAQLGGVRLASALPAALLGAAFAADLLVESFLHATVHGGHRPDWRTARDAVLHAAGRADRITVVAGEGYDSLVYYLRPNQWRDRTVDPHPGRALLPMAADGLAIRDDLLQAAGRVSAVFLVLLRPEYEALQPDAAARARLERQFRTVAVAPSAFAAAEHTVYVLQLQLETPR